MSQYLYKIYTHHSIYIITILHSCSPKKYRLKDMYKRTQAIGPSYCNLIEAPLD